MKGLNKRSARVGSLLLLVLLCFSVVVYGCLRFLTGLDMMSGRSYYCLSSCTFLRLFTVVYGCLRSFTVVCVSLWVFMASRFHGFRIVTIVTTVKFFRCYRIRYPHCIGMASHSFRQAEHD